VLSKICPGCSQNISKTRRKAIFMVCVRSPLSFALAFSDIVAEVELSQVLNSDACSFQETTLSAISITDVQRYIHMELL